MFKWIGRLSASVFMVVLGLLVLVGGNVLADKGAGDSADLIDPDSCGLRWRAVASPNTTPDEANELNDVVVISGDNAWAAGNYATGVGTFRTLIQHWDGTEWTIVPSPNAAGSASGSFLNAITAVSANDIWAGGYYYGAGGTVKAFLLHYNGTAWSISQTNIDGRIESLAAVSANNVWAVGSKYVAPSSRTVTLSWNGSIWSTVSSPNSGAADNFLYDVSATADGTVYAVGEYLDAQNNPQSLIIRRIGGQWQLMSFPAPGTDHSLQGVEVISSGDVWAVGEYDTAQDDNMTFTIHLVNGSWTYVPSPNASTRTNILNDVSATGSGDVWAVGNYTTIGNVVQKTLSMHWDGNQWTLVPVPDGIGQNSDLQAVGAIAADDALAIGAYRNSSNDYSTYIVRWGDPCIHPPVCVISYSDVPEGSTFYNYIQCLACQGVIGGYEDNTFRPGNNITRGQLSKIVANSADFVEDPGPRLFEDVPEDSTFFVFVQRLANRDIISGYACGGAGEPCGNPALPYFRPGANATRGQITKIVSNAAGFTDVHPEESFQDVPVGNTFHLWVERLASRNVMSGYPCGGPGEPCVGPLNKPYFRPGDNATRGQISKIVGNTFFVDCPVP